MEAASSLLVGPVFSKLCCEMPEILNIAASLGHDTSNSNAGHLPAVRMNGAGRKMPLPRKAGFRRQNA